MGRALSGLMLAIASALGAALGATPAHAQPLIADLSKHLVAITTGFTGSDVLVFGAVDGKGDVVVVIQGPSADVVVRRKARVSGIWVNQDSMTFAGAPSYYAVAATGPLAKIVPEAIARQEQIGVKYLRLKPKAGETRDLQELAAFRRALVRLRARAELYPKRRFPVTLIGNRLFRAELHFPANVPTGIYTVRFFLLRDGKIIGGSSSPLYVNKTGVNAEITAFAREQSILYGLLAVLVAGFLGWLAGVVFRKD
jgi:uncharacterized protein (TIGR02186 family)